MVAMVTYTPMLHNHCPTDGIFFGRYFLREYSTAGLQYTDFETLEPDLEIPSVIDVTALSKKSPCIRPVWDPGSYTGLALQCAAVERHTGLVSWREVKWIKVSLLFRTLLLVSRFSI